MLAVLMTFKGFERMCQKLLAPSVQSSATVLPLRPSTTIIALHRISGGAWLASFYARHILLTSEAPYLNGEHLW